MGWEDEPFCQVYGPENINSEAMTRDCCCGSKTLGVLREAIQQKQQGRTSMNESGMVEGGLQEV